MEKSEPIDIQSVKQWNETLRESKAAGKTVLVDFHAQWCQPCKIMAPRFSMLASQNPHVVFLRVDTDQQQAIAAKYQVTAMPTFVAIKAGKVVEAIRGADPQGLGRLVVQHGGPNPPVPPLPTEAEAAKEAGNDFYKGGKYAEAIEQYTTAISIAPHSAALYGNRSIAYLKSTPPDFELALADARRATETEPKWGKGYVRLGEALQALGKNEEAAKAFVQAVELSQGLVKAEVTKKLEIVKQSLGC
ncbi:thioredoxin-domain-containing protein, partial [Mycena pura]